MSQDARMATDDRRPIRTVCSWCKVVIVDVPQDERGVSDGICETCEARFRARVLLRRYRGETSEAMEDLQNLSRRFVDLVEAGAALSSAFEQIDRLLPVLSTKGVYPSASLTLVEELALALHEALPYLPEESESALSARRALQTAERTSWRPEVTRRVRAHLVARGCYAEVRGE